MDTSKAHYIWIEQCEAAHAIKAQYGVDAAFDYLVGEKLINFVNAAAEHADFARELPRFVSEVRRTFTTDEIGVHLARIERAQEQKDDDILGEEEDVFRESPAAFAEHARQFRLVKEILMAPTLGNFVKTAIRRLGQLRSISAPRPSQKAALVCKGQSLHWQGWSGPPQLAEDALSGQALQPRAISCRNYLHCKTRLVAPDFHSTELLIGLPQSERESYR